MDDTDIVAIRIDSFVTNNPETIVKILTSRKRKRAQSVSRGMAKAMARIFDNPLWYGLVDAPALAVKSNNHE